MRLICPNCDAEYEVDASVIPEGGRDVQCSSCGHAWYQMPLSAVAEPPPAPPPFGPPPSFAAAGEDGADPADEPPAAPQPAAPPPVVPARPRALEQSVLAVLREEAEREAAARRAEAPPSAMETQEEMALTELPARAVPPRFAPDSPRATGAEPEPVSLADPAPAVTERTPRRDLLPDIEEINSSLRPGGGPGGGDAVADAAGRSAAHPGAGSGFRTGFVLMLVLAGLVVALYALAPRLAEQMPAAAPTLDRFVAVIDDLRMALDGLMKSVIGALGDKGAAG